MNRALEIALDAGAATFATGLLPDLIASLKACAPGGVIRVTGSHPDLGPDLEVWCRFTRNVLVDVTEDAGATRWTIRCGELPRDVESDRSVGSRLWLYTNFDCNLTCDYCCVRSSPRAPRRELGLDRLVFKYSNGTLPHEYAIESIRLTGEKVIPMVRELLAQGE